MKKLIALGLLLIGLLTVIAGCGKTDSTASQATRTVTYEGTQYTIPAKPERIAVLSNSILQMLDAVGGTSVSRVESSDVLSDKLQKLPSLGHTASINMEQLLALKPDLVLGLSNQHAKFESQLQSNKLPYILITYDGIKDNVPLIEFLGDIVGQPDKAKTVIAQYNDGIAAAKAKLTGVTPARVAVLRATGKAVTAEAEKAITASMVKELGMDNVVLNHKELADSTAKTVPYSLETLAVDDPDVIFIVTMGKKEDITKTMEKEMTGNPAWNNLKAVKNGKVFYLPSNLFLLNPGLHTPDAMNELIKDAYNL
ncbi:ABC transporter substrate-binding protein [uncultured Veillonella sp.]|uniref:ABC transporter substrate-binding protein n=1 Tax=uncultured Veillonella sp. TaxID=159268 RepID=UPI002582B7DA|nr:ABC transporter substrate-binding protein [uncultured Veillonella sp.]